MGEAEQVMRLFDSCWFESEIFKKQQQQPSPSNSETSPDHGIQEKPSESEISSLPTLHTRSMSDESSSKTDFTADSLAPNLVLSAPKLHTIFSGKQISEEIAEQTHSESELSSSSSSSKKVIRNRGLRTKKGLSKSLSELEFEELKGFMDLGFVFSEQDKLSSLGSIIPGLQRLGKKSEGIHEDNGGFEEPPAPVSRPYLSEAWEVLDRIKEEKPLMNWRIPSFSNETGVKDSLRFWAHSVASTVR